MSVAFFLSGFKDARDSSRKPGLHRLQRRVHFIGAADTLGDIMIVVTARVRARTETRREFLQTVQSLIGPTRREKGCMSCHWYTDIEDENTFSLVEEWETRQDVKNHLKSDPIRVLTGAILLLCEPSPLEINTLADTPEVNAIKAALGGDSK
jgi:quinol monooxygenase YgiN